jgi:hypothetical protein
LLAVHGLERRGGGDGGQGIIKGEPSGQVVGGNAVAILFESGEVVFFAVAQGHEGEAMAAGGQAADEVVGTHADEVGDVGDEEEDVHEGFGIANGEWRVANCDSRIEN